jgi:ribosome-associated protein
VTTFELIASPSGLGHDVSEFNRRTIRLTERPINLTQLLKLAGCAESGGAAKALIAAGQVRIDGQVELRKRRKLKAGEIVAIDGGPTVELSE